MLQILIFHFSKIIFNIPLYLDSGLLEIVISKLISIIINIQVLVSYNI